jgi:2-polyprenyl-6-methoxyphenol hydroxylase-like FAD-dependent oxidoreductase
MMLGYLLARSGVQTILVEKHGDFLRDFRGDTVHPSTTDLMHELGILDGFLREVPHQTIEQLGIGFKGKTFDLIDFRHLPTACKYVVFMPQWDFLNFLADKAKQFPSFRLEMNTEVTGLLREGDRVVGVTAQSKGGPLEIRADVTVACDGRWSVIRDQSGLPVEEFRCRSTCCGSGFRGPTPPLKLSDISVAARSSSQSTVVSTGSVEPSSIRAASTGCRMTGYRNSGLGLPRPHRFWPPAWTH